MCLPNTLFLLLPDNIIVYSRTAVNVGWMKDLGPVPLVGMLLKVMPFPKQRSTAAARRESRQPKHYSALCSLSASTFARLPHLETNPRSFVPATPLPSCSAPSYISDAAVPVADAEAAVDSAPRVVHYTSTQFSFTFRWL